MNTAKSYLFGLSFLILVFPARLPAAVTILGGAAFGVAFWFWLKERMQ